MSAASPPRLKRRYRLGCSISPISLIDFRLADGGLGTEVAIHLRAQSRIGVLYATGNSIALGDAEGEACLAKPYQAKDLMRGLAIVTEYVAVGNSALPFPRGFRLLHRPYSQPVAFNNG